MSNILKVISKTEPNSIQKQDGSTVQKSIVVLQELGGRYEDSYAVTLLGDLAMMQLYPGDIVAASLRFQAKQYAPPATGDNPTRMTFLMDVTATSLIKLQTL